MSVRQLIGDTFRPESKADRRLREDRDAEMAVDRDWFSTFGWIEYQFHVAEAKGRKTLLLELPVETWIALFDEVKNRRPRNISYLFGDDVAFRLEQAIDRLHGEANMMIALGQRGSVARRYSPKDAASPALRRAMEEKDQKGNSQGGDGQG